MSSFLLASKTLFFVTKLLFFKARLSGEAGGSGLGLVVPGNVGIGALNGAPGMGLRVKDLLHNTIVVHRANWPRFLIL